MCSLQAELSLYRRVRQLPGYELWMSQTDFAWVWAVNEAGQAVSNSSLAFCFLFFVLPLFILGGCFVVVVTAAACVLPVKPSWPVLVQSWGILGNMTPGRLTLERLTWEQSVVALGRSVGICQGHRGSSGRYQVARWLSRGHCCFTPRLGVPIPRPSVHVEFACCVGFSSSAWSKIIIDAEN